MDKKRDEGEIWHEAYLSLGSNIGDREANLTMAIHKLNNAQTRICAKSAIYETEPWGMETDEWFLNMCLRIETTLNPPELLDEILHVEQELGRVREADSKGYQSRSIDIDILFYDKVVLSSEALTIPHPHIQFRLFILKAIVDIAPLVNHPKLNKTCTELLDECPDKQEVRIWK